MNATLSPASLSGSWMFFHFAKSKYPDVPKQTIGPR